MSHPTSSFLSLLLVCVGCLAVSSGVAKAQEQIPPEGLVEMRESVIEAFNTKDLELLLSHCHDDVIAIWQDGQVGIGKEGVRKIIEDLTENNDLIAEYKAAPTVDHRTLIGDGDVVVSMGQLNDVYTVTKPTRSQLSLNSQWTAVVIRLDDRWQIISFHVSADAFDNEAISLIQSVGQWTVGSIAGVTCLVLGILIGFMVSRRRKVTLEPSTAPDTSN